MKEFWNERYSREAYAYGEDPNEYLKARLAGMPAGKALFPAEGEGRNAVFSATLGWEVSAFDQSGTAKKKAGSLARKKGVCIDYTVSELADITYSESSFDALILIFAHFPAGQRREYHRKLSTLLKRGGVLILEAFSKAHEKKQKEDPDAGGPRDNRLCTPEMLKADFPEFDFIECYETETDLDEGLYHRGKASVIRICATKK